PPPLDRLEERRLLAQDEAAGAPPDLHVEGEVRAEDAGSEEPGRPGRLDRGRAALGRQPGLAVYIEDAPAGARRVGGDQEALQDPVGVRLHQVAVLEDPRLALLAVDDDVLRRA